MSAWIIFLVILVVYIVYCLFDRHEAAVINPQICKQVDYETILPNLKSGDLILYTIHMSHMNRILMGSRYSHVGLVYINEKFPNEPYMLHLATRRLTLHPLKFVLQKQKKKNRQVVIRHIHEPITYRQTALLEEVIRSPFTTLAVKNPFTNELIPKSKKIRKANLLYMDSGKPYSTFDYYFAQLIGSPVAVINHLTPVHTRFERSVFCTDFLIKLMIHLEILQAHSNLYINAISGYLFQSDTSCLNDYVNYANWYEPDELFIKFSSIENESK